MLKRSQTLRPSLRNSVLATAY
ncbi:hypothetical protein PENSOL_c138G03198 [Penicillium solitum]|uniref:Uncharacterized protein n=1 Tax=Penicillium solitum TaxID=60172 RepID=A0A1V6Q4U7_9EURO|nr:hypothetical protein PENSOL_c138G03198 [Penicillium solitum]